MLIAAGAKGWIESAEPDGAREVEAEDTVYVVGAHQIDWPIGNRTEVSPC